MPLKIYCVNLGREIEAEGGETLGGLLQRIKGEIPFSPICARVNNKTESLHYPLYGPKRVEYIDGATQSGQRVYVRSMCMMLYRAVSAVAPGARLRIMHSIAKGYYCRLEGVEVTQGLMDSVKSHMRRLSERDLPFERHERPTEDVIEIFRAQGLDDKVRLLETLHELYTVYYTLDGIADSYNSALAPSTGCIKVFGLEIYKEGFLLLGPDAVNPDVPQQPVTQEKMYEAFTNYLDFNRIIGVRNAGELNSAVEGGHGSMLINVAEALHEKKIAVISDEIKHLYDRGGARIVLIAGPSSSGKTTFTKRLAIQLMTNLLEPTMISLDDYFVDRDMTPRDESGDYDYESLYALDLQKFNEDLNRLIIGEEIEMPTYNFESGRREYKGRKITLTGKSVLLFEGNHGLNPDLTASVAAKMKYRVYVSALTTIAIDDHNWVPTTDNRLLRRIIRDNKYRGASPIDTIRRWPSVRRGEEKWIFPYQENADATFNSSLIFELSVMREQAERVLKTVPQDVTEYAEAYRLRRFLHFFAPIAPYFTPPTSLLREFMGGSSFHY